MEPDLAERLIADEGRAALADAATETDPSSLAAATRLRRDHDPQLAAAASAQETLRRRAVTKLGAEAEDWYWTADGLEQATRGPVAAWRADRLVEAGHRRIVDLGCGLGVDAAAMARAGLEVVAVERDPVTATFARANLAPLGVVVHTGDAVGWAPRLLDDTTAVFCDPARRTTRGRSWQVADFSPPYELVRGWLGEHGGMVKLGPGLPYHLIGEDADVTWVSDRGDVVEAALVPGPGLREAVVLPEGSRLTAGGDPVGTGPVGRFLLEPDGAVIRAGATDVLARRIGAHRLDPRIAYLCCDDEPPESEFATRFLVREVLAWKEATLRAWVRDQGIGTLEIKKRGIELDPAQLRRRLRPRGRAAATVVITPTTDGARAVVVDRIDGPRRSG